MWGLGFRRQQNSVVGADGGGLSLEAEALMWLALGYHVRDFGGS